MYCTLKHWGIPVEERKISIDEVIEAYKNGTLDEAFGSGTAAVISPIGELYDGDTKMVINNNEIGNISKHLYDTITGMQWGKFLIAWAGLKNRLIIMPSILVKVKAYILKVLDKWVL